CVIRRHAIVVQVNAKLPVRKNRISANEITSGVDVIAQHTSTKIKSDNVTRASNCATYRIIMGSKKQIDSIDIISYCKYATGICSYIIALDYISTGVAVLYINAIKPIS